LFLVSVGQSYNFLKMSDEFCLLFILHKAIGTN
jgi:hypothetical protein